MKKLPKSVLIFGRKIPIKNIPGKKIIELYPEFTQPPLGLWDSSKREIIINSDFPIEDQKYTLKHEMAHSSFTFTGIDLIIDPALQEIIVQTVATLIEDILNQAQTLK
jgi:Zn-dependent peptidase ImmA (M78 family)